MQSLYLETCMHADRHTKSAIPAIKKLKRISYMDRVLVKQDTVSDSEIDVYVL